MFNDDDMVTVLHTYIRFIINRVTFAAEYDAHTCSKVYLQYIQFNVRM